MDKQKLLTIDEVATYLRMAPNTVYRWCREGKLTAIKLAKEWRVSPDDLEQFVNARRTGDRAAPLEDIINGHLTPPEHILVMMTDPDAVYQLEAGFFKIGMLQDRLLYKGCWWQHPDEVRQRFTAEGLPVEVLESEGRLVIDDFRARYRQFGPEGVFQAWIERATAFSRDLFWGAGSHLVNDWAGNFDGLHDFEARLHALLRKLPVVVLCCCVVAPADTAATATLLDLAAHHTGSLFVVQGDAVLMRPVSVG